MYITSLLSDKNLISKYIQGNEAAIEVLINRYKNKIFTYLLVMVKNKQLAEDLFQDALIKVINTLKRGKYNEEGKFLPWVLRISHNLAIDYFRKSGRMPVAEGSEDFDIFSVIPLKDRNIEENMVREQIHNDIKKLIEYLPDEQKEVVIMRHFRRMSFKDIAEETDVSINTALGRMRYALINLRKIIDERKVNLTIV